MAGEFKHVETSGGRTEDQYEGVSEHLFDGQATGDLAYADDATHIKRLAIGTEGYKLKVSSGKPAWVEDTGNIATDTLWDAKGDLVVGTGANTGARLAVGANHTRPVADSAETTGVKWAAEIASISFIIDGGGSAISTGLKGFLEIPFACTVLAWTVLADVAGAIVIDVWKDTYANFPPTNADAMPGAGHEPTIAATNQKGQDTDASDWATVAIAAGSVLGFNVDSCTTITKATLSLKVQKTY